MRVLLVEFRSHRTEALSAYNVFSAAGYETHIALPEKEVISKNELPNTHIIPSSHKNTQGYKPAISRTMAVLSLLKKLDIDVIFINTFQGRDIEFLLLRLFLSRKYKIAALIHNSDILHKIKLKFLVKRVNLLLALSQDISEYIKKKFNIEAKTFQAIDFLTGYNYKDFKVSRDPSRVYIAVAGGIILKRRNYMWLIEQCIKHKDKLTGKIVFDIIGNAQSVDGMKITELVRRNGLDEIFELHHYHVGDDEYFARIDACAAVIALTNNIRYTYCKMHGSQVMAAAFKKLYLQDERYIAESMRPVSLIYNDDNFSERLLELHADKTRTDVKDGYGRMESMPLSYRVNLVNTLRAF